jgi:hypothetical protein
MRVNRQQQSARTFLVLAVLLASFWTANLAAPAAADATNHLTASRLLPGIEPAILRGRLPMVRPPVERQGPGGRLVPALLGVVVAAVAVAAWVHAGWSRPGSARAWSLTRSTRREARAPPFLQPA